MSFVFFSLDPLADTKFILAYLAVISIKWILRDIIVLEILLTTQMKSLKDGYFLLNQVSSITLVHMW